MRKKRYLTLTVIICLIASFLMPSAHAGAVAEPISAKDISAKSAILLDVGDGGAGVLWEKNAHARLPMASTTKIMTALVAIEALPLSTVV